MSFKVVCDACGREATAAVNILGDPLVPTDPETGIRWSSRVDRGDKGAQVIHSCSPGCRERAGVSS